METRIRFGYTVEDDMKYLSHLDLMRLFQRALRRSGLPLAYSRGFNPHVRLFLAAPLPLGVTASGECGDAFFSEPVQPDHFLKDLGGQLPPGVALTGASTVGLDQPSLGAVVSAAMYHAQWAGPGPAPGRVALQEALEELLSRPTILIQRRGKGGKVDTVDLRPFIFEVAVRPGRSAEAGVAMLLQLGSRGGASPYRVLEQIGPAGINVDQSCWRLHRQGLYAGDKGKFEALC